MQQKSSSALRGVVRWFPALLIALTACPQGDLGAPCNHGRIEPPDSKVVTFPALACNQLLCVYADEEEPPGGDCVVGDPEDGDAYCNGDTDALKFECVPTGLEDEDPTNDEEGICQLRVQFVLERSMCSRKCDTDADCQDGGVGQKVIAEGNNCGSGFKCARIQSLGEFCCQKLCVCNDDLGLTTDLDRECSAGTQAGCCVDPMGDPVNPPPEGCFQPL